ncbi:hypothetical protein ACH35V_32435 [Actinomadura sp. 1N219]|uniref:hypothetical protein n=1 Tax=Actinomadura sp. 1N219 TaxID=3375152 RepID=UPI0037AB5ACF
MFDDEHVIAYGGLVPVMQLAERCGLPGLVIEHVRDRERCGANDAAKVCSIVAGMAAGADGQTAGAGGQAANRARQASHTPNPPPTSRNRPPGKRLDQKPTNRIHAVDSGSDKGTRCHLPYTQAIPTRCVCDRPAKRHEHRAITTAG